MPLNASIFLGTTASAQATAILRFMKQCRTVVLCCIQTDQHAGVAEVPSDPLSQTEWCCTPVTGLPTEQSRGAPENL